MLRSTYCVWVAEGQRGVDVGGRRCGANQELFMTTIVDGKKPFL